MEFIKLEPEHIKEMYDIRFSVEENFVHLHQIKYLQRQQVIEDIEQGGGWICKLGEEFVGYGLGIFAPNPMIGGLFVRPEFQGKGIGSTILIEIMDWFFNDDLSEIELTTDPSSNAVLFYEKHGWAKAGFDEFGQLVMKVTGK